MVAGLLLHSPRLAWTGTDQTDHRGSGATRREAGCYRDRSVSRRSKLPELSLYGIRTDVPIGGILRGWPSWNTSACLAPRVTRAGRACPAPCASQWQLLAPSGRAKSARSCPLNAADRKSFDLLSISADDPKRTSAASRVVAMLDHRCAQQAT